MNEMSESHEDHETNEQNDDGKSRRGVLALLGLGLLGTRALAGCAVPSAQRDDGTGEARQALFSGATVMTADTVTDLRGNAGSSSTVAVLRGYDASSTPGSADGVFAWDSSVTGGMDNGGTVFAVTAGGGWRRIFSGALDVRWFGARGNGSTDDTAAIQSAITAAVQTGHEVFLPPGTYKVSATLLIGAASGVRVRGAGMKTIIAPTDAIVGLPVFLLARCIRCGVSDMWIQGYPNAPPSCAWDSRVVAQGSQAPNRNFIERVLIGSESPNSFVDGIRFSCDAGYDGNNDQGRITHVDIQNVSNAGIAILHDNSVWHEIRGGSISYTPKGVYLEGGSFSMFGTSLACSSVNFQFAAPRVRYEHPSFVSASASESGATLISVDNIDQVRFFLTNFTHKGGFANTTPILFRSYYGRLSLIGCDVSFGQPNVTCRVDGAQSSVSFVDCSVGFTDYVAQHATCKIRRRDPRHWAGTATDSGPGSIVETT